MAHTGGYPLGLNAWLSVVHGQAVVVEGLSKALEEEAGIPLAWFEVLLFLGDHPEGRMTMNELAGSVLLSKSGVTRLVDRMVEAGLVDRQTCETDRRVVYAAITEKGRASLEEALPAHRLAVERLFVAHLTRDELSTLQALMAKVVTGNGVGPRVCPSIVAGTAAKKQPARA